MILVIGGGITGLSVAYFLSAKGHNVTVVEKDPQLGGNATWTKLGRFTVDSFYHVITSRDVYFLRLIKELGIEDSLIPVKIRMGFYQNEKLYSISTPMEFFFFPPLSFLERVRLAISIIRSKATQNWEELETITACQWLSSIGGINNYKKLWGPILRSKFGKAAERVVATDMLFRINRIAGARDRNLKEKVYSLKGSLKTFFDKLEDRLVNKGVVIFKGTSVNKIKTINGRAQWVLLDNQKELSCDKIICTTPLPDFIRLLPDGYGEYAKNLGSIEYLNNACLILRLKKQFSPYYQVNLGDDSFPFTGIIGADALYPPVDFEDSYVLCVSKYFAEECKVFNMDQHNLLDYYLPYLKKICPDFEVDWVLDMVLTKKRNIEPLHTLGYSKLKPPFETPIKNLYLLCTAQIYPEPTVLNASVEYAGRLVDQFF